METLPRLGRLITQDPWTFHQNLISSQPKNDTAPKCAEPLLTKLFNHNNNYIHECNHNSHSSQKFALYNIKFLAN